MAQEVTLDLVDENNGTYNWMGWQELVRKAIVKGVEGEGFERIVQAKETVGMPELYDPHPAVDYCLLREIRFESVDNETVVLRLIYRRTQRGDAQRAQKTIETGASLSQVSTNQDYEGTVFKVDHDFPPGYKSSIDAEPLAGTTTSPTQSLEVPLLIPESTITISKRESSDPASKARDYVGKVNSGSWTWDTSAPARTWMCTGIVGRSDDGGDHFNVTYSFQYRADTWDTTIVFIDPNTSRPPVDLVSGTMGQTAGQKTVQMYSTADFNNLNL